MEENFVTKNNLSNIMVGIKNAILNFEEILEEAYKIDKKYTKMKFDTKELLLILDKLKCESVEETEEERIFINYSGNPYLTLNLCILALTTNKTIWLDCRDYMLMVNKEIENIVNQVLETYRIKPKVFLASNAKIEALEGISKFICIDDINQYNYYIRKGIENIKFYSHEYLDLYCDTEEYEKLVEEIYKYSENNRINIESYSEFNLDEAVKLLEKGKGKAVLILTKNSKTEETLKNKIKDKPIYVNKNPFNTNYRILNKEIMYV